MFRGGLDAAVRIGTLADSRLIARRIGVNRRRLVGAPAYLKRFNAPSHPSDLVEHSCRGTCRSPRPTSGNSRTRAASVLPSADGAPARQQPAVGFGHIIPRISARDIVADLFAPKPAPFAEPGTPNPHYPHTARLVAWAGPGAFDQRSPAHPNRSALARRFCTV
jgi:hypothetical protein